MPRPTRLMAGVDEGSQVYFTHSYAAPVIDDTAAICEYGVPFSAAVERGNVVGGAVSSREVRRHRAADPEQLAQPVAPSSESERRQMLSKRIIACLDVRDGKVVKGVNFEGLRDAGDPAALARRYNVEGIDEIVILDVTATIESRQARAHTIAAVAQEIFLPLAVGGGIRNEEDAAAAIEAGADKVSLNTAALERSEPDHHAREALRQPGGDRGDRCEAVRLKPDTTRVTRCLRAAARPATNRDAVEWAREATDRGAGEILLTSIDRDGTKAGFDCEMTAAVSDAVNIPVIASGGAGTFEHFADVFGAGHADAALAASIFHFNEKSVRELKEFLAKQQIPVRL